MVHVYALLKTGQPLGGHRLPGRSLFSLATLLAASEDVMSSRLISFPQVLLPPREGEVSWGWSETVHSHLLSIR